MLCDMLVFFHSLIAERGDHLIVLYRGPKNRHKTYRKINTGNVVGHVVHPDFSAFAFGAKREIANF